VSRLESIKGPFNIRLRFYCLTTFRKVFFTWWRALTAWNTFVEDEYEAVTTITTEGVISTNGTTEQTIGVKPRTTATATGEAT